MSAGAVSFALSLFRSGNFRLDSLCRLLDIVTIQFANDITIYLLKKFCFLESQRNNFYNITLRISGKEYLGL
jgi:hypothetical protein